MPALQTGGADPVADLVDLLCAAVGGIDGHPGRALAAHLA